MENHKITNYIVSSIILNNLIIKLWIGSVYAPKKEKNIT